MLTVALPSTQDYIVWVSAGNQAANFSLSVTIPSRIRFAPGGISATVDGTVSGHMQVSYILRASAGQTMTVDLIGSNVGLTIYGLSDGHAAGARRRRGHFLDRQAARHAGLHSHRRPGGGFDHLYVEG